MVFLGLKMLMGIKPVVFTENKKQLKRRSKQLKTLSTDEEKKVS